MSSIPRHDDAEKGTLEKPPIIIADSEKQTLTSPQPAAVAVTLSKVEKPKPAKKKASKWVRWRIWFNTYRKFFTFVMTLNLTGVVLAATGHFPYARKYTGALVLGNLYAAILVRNELFGRFLYLIVNTLFAKVSRVLWIRFRRILRLVYSGHHCGGG